MIEVAGRNAGSGQAGLLGAERCLGNIRSILRSKPKNSFRSVAWKPLAGVRLRPLGHISAGPIGRRAEKQGENTRDARFCNLRVGADLSTSRHRLASQFGKFRSTLVEAVIGSGDVVASSSLGPEQLAFWRDEASMLPAWW